MSAGTVVASPADDGGGLTVTCSRCRVEHFVFDLSVEPPPWQSLCGACQIEQAEQASRKKGAGREQ